MFGRFALLTADGSELRFSRRKALHLLAYLVLYPEGLPVTELADRLFEPGGDTPPLLALHLAAHALRQALKGIGGDALFDSSQGLFRLDWDGIAFCDLREFDAF